MKISKTKVTLVADLKSLPKAKEYANEEKTPIRIKKVLGDELYEETEAFIAEFDNPMAANYARSHKMLSHAMDENLASSITIYLDKMFDRPAVVLFPTNDVIYMAGSREYSLSRLNHAARRDLEYQMKRRAKIIQDYNIQRQTANQERKARAAEAHAKMQEIKAQRAAMIAKSDKIK